MGEKRKWCCDNWKRMKLDHYFTSYTKYQHKMKQRNTLKSYIKGENIGVNLHELGFGS